MFTVFFDCNGVVHHEFLQQGCTVSKEYYLEVVRRLCEAIRKKRTKLWKNNRGFCTHQYLAPADSFIFTKLKTPMKEKCFVTIEEIKEKSKQELLATIKGEFQKCFEIALSVLYLRAVTLKGTR